MMTSNSILYSSKILGKIVRDIIYFPLWWYTEGLITIGKKLLIFLQNRQKSLALLIWIKNIHRPMYRQYDWQGMFISFFMRVIQIIIRSMIMIFWLIIALIIFFSWIILPIFVIYEIIFQLNA